MSYGREPYYIYHSGSGSGYFNFVGLGIDRMVSVPYDAMAQFIATMVNRGELTTLIERGKELRPEISKKLRAQVYNVGWEREG